MIIKNQISKGLMGCLFVFFCLFIFSGCSTMKNWFSFLTDSDSIKTAEQLDEKELKDFMTSVEPVKGDANRQYRVARHFQKLNRHEIAVEEFLKALKIDPEFYNAYNALGVSYDNLKQHDSAIDAYSAALKINPDLDYVYNNIGYSHLLKGDLEAAAIAFEKAVAMNASNKIYQNNLALVQAKSGKNSSLTAVSHKVEKQALNPTVGKDQITREMLTKIIDTDRVIGKKKAEDNYYAVQLGVYYDMNKAVQTLEKARKRGYDSPYMTKIKKENPYYRVRFGKYNTRAEAEVLASTILDKGGRPALTIVETYPVDVFQSGPLQYTALHKSLKIEVLNGNGIYRMARRVGNYFK
ncbi:MAG: tetratricopeptide repeat protein, partial [Desulfobacula sp.]|nr:tetratricopeptide repeat protein [Desulfobacula sp.]